MYDDPGGSAHTQAEEPGGSGTIEIYADTSGPRRLTTLVVFVAAMLGASTGVLIVAAVIEGRAPDIKTIGVIAGALLATGATVWLSIHTRRRNRFLQTHPILRYDGHGIEALFGVESVSVPWDTVIRTTVWRSRYKDELALVVDPEYTGAHRNGLWRQFERWVYRKLIHGTWVSLANSLYVDDIDALRALIDARLAEYRLEHGSRDV